MSDSQSQFPLFNRIVVFIASILLVLGVPVVAVVSIQRNAFDPANGFVMVVFFLFGCGGTWLSLFWKNRTPQEIDEELSVASARQPEIAASAISCSFATPTDAAAVYLDADDGVIHFQNCHVPRRLIASASEWFTCRVDEILAVHLFRYRGESLTIVTPEGKAVIPESGTGYAEFRDRIRQSVPFTQPGFSTDHPMMGFVYLLGALGGLFLGFLLTPQNSSDATLGVFVLIGAFLGTVCSFVLVWSADHIWQTSIVQPLGFAVVGGSIGLFVSKWLTPWLGWNLMVVAVLSLIGGVAGVAYGAKKQQREQAPVDAAEQEQQ